MAADAGETSRDASTIQEALLRHYAAHGLPMDGGESRASFRVRLGRISIWLPNPPARRRAVFFHDVNHLLTGYDTTFSKGEMDIAAFEIGTGCGPVSSTGAGDLIAARTPVHRPPATSRAAHSVTVHFAKGRQGARFTLPEPKGVILLYRLRAPAGMDVHGSTQLPSVSAPLQISTSSLGPTGSCHVKAARITCTVAEEWCPMPAGTWRVRLHKPAGGAGDVTLWFRVGPPPAD